MTPPSKSAVLGLLALLLLGWGLLAAELDGAGISRAGEARAALSGRNMARNGNWTLPLPGGRLQADRPPLHDWAIALASDEGEGSSEIPSRLPSVIAGLLCAATAFAAGGPGSALILLASPCFVFFARSGEPGAMLALWVMWSALCLRNALRSASRPGVAGLWVFAAAIASGLAFMTSGLLGAALPWLPFIFFPRARPPRAILAWFALGVIAALAICLPWILLLSDMEEKGQSLVLGVLLGPFQDGASYIGGAARRAAGLALGMGLFAAMIPSALARAWSRRADTAERYLFLLACVGAASIVILPGRNGEIAALFPILALLVGSPREEYEGAPRNARLLEIAFWVGLALMALVGAALPSIAMFYGALALAIARAAAALASRQGMALPQALRSAPARIALLSIAAQAGWFLEGAPRLALFDGSREFARRVESKLPDNSQIYTLGRIDDAFRFYLNHPLPEIRGLDALPPLSDAPAFLLTQEAIAACREHPRLGEALAKPRHWAAPRPAALFEIFGEAAPDTGPMPRRKSALGPLRLAALGDMGTGDVSQYLVAGQLDRLDRGDPLDGLLFLGDLIYSLDWYKPFDLEMKIELPYRPLMRRGAPIRSVLGNHDHDNYSIVMNYPPLGLNGVGRRLVSYRGGLCDVFLIDSVRLNLKYSTLEQQRDEVEWLRAALEKSRARWKIVALHNPPYSVAREGDGHEAIRGLVEPLFKQFGVRVVLSGDHHVYERMELGPGEPVYFVAGSSGKLDEETEFPADPRLKASNAATEAFLYLEIEWEEIRYRAIGKEGIDLDAGTIEYSAP